MIGFLATGVTLATAAAPSVLPFNPQLPDDCITLSSGAVLTEGLPVRMSGQTVESLEGRSVCDAHGNQATVAGGVLTALTTYLSPESLTAAPSPAAPPVLTVNDDDDDDAGDISGTIIGCSILGGFATLFAGGVWLAVHQSNRHHPPGMWESLPAALPPAPTLRDQLEGLYSASPGYAQSPGVTACDSKSRLSQPKNETSQLRQHVTAETGKWDEWGEPLEDEIVDIRGMALSDFKANHDPMGGDFLLENLAYPDMVSVAQRRLFDYVRQYGCINPRCAVWSIFGLTHKGGNSPSAKRYQQAAEWVKGEFKNDDFTFF